MGDCLKVRFCRVRGGWACSAILLLFSAQPQPLSAPAHGDPAADPAGPPYPPSAVLADITWHWDSLRTAAPGSDLWPVTWAEDGDIYTAWGDGGGFGGNDSDGRVALGFARISGTPDDYRAANVNGGKGALFPASFPRAGKAEALAAVGPTLYAWVNLQDGPWPDVNYALAWSANRGASWALCPWRFERGAGRLKPGAFLNFGRAYTGVPRPLAGYVYFYASPQGNRKDIFLGRVAVQQVRDQTAYRFFAGLDGRRPRWSHQAEDAVSVFHDEHDMGDTASVVYMPALKRYLLTTFHQGPGQLGVFDAPDPWGPWTTVAYYEDWGGMGARGVGLTCSFPAKWMSPDGRNVWCVFSAYGDGAQQGIRAHDRFNLVRATLVPRRRRNHAAP